MNAIPIAVFLAAIIFILCGGKLTVDDILSYTPSQPLLAALVLWLMFAVKSLSVVLPSLILMVASGILFPLPIAFLVNFIGMAVTFSIPYFNGRCNGGDFADEFVEKYPKIQFFRRFREKHDFFFAFFVRLIGVLPYDPVSAYFGAIKVPYASYISGCLLGCLPRTCLITLMGSAIDEPGSPEFIISLSLQVLLTVISTLVFLIMVRKETRKSRAVKCTDIPETAVKQ